MSQLTEKSKQVGQKIKLGYDDLGQGGLAVVLMSGYCGERSMYAGVAELLSNKYRVLPTDLLGQNESSRPNYDFGANDILEALIEYVDALGLDPFIVASYAHANWLTLALRERLGRRVRKLIWFDWLVTEPTKAFFKGLENQQKPDKWEETRDKYFDSWSDYDSQLRKVFEKYMGSYDFDCWRRAGREIAKTWKQEGSPLKRLEAMEPIPPVVHIYSAVQGERFYGDGENYFQAQKAFSRKHPNFKVARLSSTRSHMPFAENPQAVAEVIEKFIEEKR